MSDRQITRLNCANGIVVKIWDVGSVNNELASSKSTESNLSDSVKYIDNPEKCSFDESALGQINRSLTYVKNDVKTLNGLLVGGRHIKDISNAVSEMMEVKNYFGKVGGRVATHGVVSLPVSESDVKNAPKLMELINDVLKELWGDAQAVYAVHTNTDNLHVHFIVNSVMLDGKKIHKDKNFIRKRLQPVVNKYAIRYGFAPNLVWNENEKEIKKEDVIRYKMSLRDYIDDAIEYTDDFDTFLSYLRAKGLTVNVGKYISLRSNDMPKAMRTRQLGKGYSKEDIIERLKIKTEPLLWKSIDRSVSYVSPKQAVYYVPKIIKKYKDMSPEEQKSAVKELRLGHNPWKDAYQENWAVKQASEKLNSKAEAYELIHHYSASDSPSDALNKIDELLEKIKEDKKRVRSEKALHKIELSLYKESKKYARKAYLYDTYKDESCKVDYIKYKAILDRLKDHFKKDINEVADYISDLNDESDYLNGAYKELERQYRLIRSGASEYSLEKEYDGLSLFKAIDRYDAKRKYADEGSVSATEFSITSNESDYIVTVKRSPVVDLDGNIIPDDKITVFDKEGHVVYKISTKDMTDEEYKDEIFEISKEYNLWHCSKHSGLKLRDYKSFNQATAIHANYDRKEERDKIKESDHDRKESEKEYTGRRDRKNL